MPDLSPRQFDQAVEKLMVELRAKIRLATEELPDGSPAAKRARHNVAKRDRFWFFKHYFPHYFEETFTPNQRQLGKLLEAHDVLLVLAFRGWGKSTLVTFGETMHELVAGGTDFAILTSRTDDQTWPLVLQLRMEFESNLRLAQDYGPFEEGPVWQADHFTLSNGVEVLGRSLKGAARGPRSLKNQRPQLWVLDDLQEIEDAENPQTIEKTLTFIRSTVIPAMAVRRRKIRIVGTKMSEDCAVARLESDPHYPHFRLDALDKDGHSTEPQRFPDDFFAEKKRLQGTDNFSREYLNTAVRKDGLVRRPWIKFYRPEELRGQPLVCGTFWDPAIAPGGDYKAIVTLGSHTGTGRLYVLEAFVRRAASPDEQAGEFCRQWERVAKDSCCAGALGYEANGFQSLMEYPVERHRQARNLAALPIQAATNTQPKELRVATMAPLFERGEVFFLEDDADQRMLADQWVFWPKGGKDGPDAMHGAWTLIQQLSAGSAIVISARQGGVSEGEALAVVWR